MAEFSWPLRIYYEDTDCGGVVYHANYLCFMERARSEWLRALGFEQDVLRQQCSVLFAVAQISVEFLLPARFNDELEVGVHLVDSRRVSLNLSQEICRAGKVLCRAEVRIACLQADTLRPHPIPPQLLAKLREALIHS